MVLVGVGWWWGRLGAVIAGTSVVHAETFAKALGVGVVTMPTPQDWVFSVGVSPSQTTFLNEAKAQGAKLCAYWIGTDSFIAKQNPQYRVGLAAFDLHLTVHERISTELLSWGIESQVVWPCPKWQGRPTDKWPDSPTVGVYEPGDDFYWPKACVQIAKECPEIKFLWYGADPFMKTPDNIEWLGRVDGSVYDRMTCLLRLCRHDGNPVGGIEAKQRGLHVIENYPYAGFLPVNSIDEAVAYLKRSKTHKIDDSIWPAFYREHCSAENFKKQVETICGS